MLDSLLAVTTLPGFVPGLVGGVLLTAIMGCVGVVVALWRDDRPAKPLPAQIIIPPAHERREHRAVPTEYTPVPLWGHRSAEL